MQRLYDAARANNACINLAAAPPATSQKVSALKRNSASSPNSRMSTVQTSTMAARKSAMLTARIRATTAAFTPRRNPHLVDSQQHGRQCNHPNPDTAPVSQRSAPQPIGGDQDDGDNCGIDAIEERCNLGERAEADVGDG